MGSYTVSFPVVSRSAKRTINCLHCDKRLTRSRTFQATVNPYNVNKETGQPKTYAEIWQELGEKADHWQPIGVCRGCSMSAPIEGNG